MWKRGCGFAGPLSNYTDNSKRCGIDDELCWESFYVAHTEKIRDFARNHPQMTYVELLLDDDAPTGLESYTGVSADCFKHCRPIGRPKEAGIDPRKHRKCQPIASESG